MALRNLFPLMKMASLALFCLLALILVMVLDND